MRFSTKASFFALLAIVFMACSKPSDPRDVSIAFIEHLNAHQFDKAAVLATEGTRQAVTDLKNEQPATEPGAGDKESLSGIFDLEALQPYVNGNKAIVKNNFVTLNLEKVDGDWQVVASKESVDNILHRTDRIASAKASWETLKKEYMNRSVLLRDYISYVKNSGRDMPEVIALEDGLKALPTVDAEPTRERILAYVQGQQKIDGLADKALQPTLTAGADLTMNYIINVQNQATRIGEAKAAYNKAAAAANSNVYTVVP
jgi:hypothetical protein